MFCVCAAEPHLLTPAIDVLPAFAALLFHGDAPIGERDAFVLIAAGKNAIQQQTMPQGALRTRQ